MRFRPWSPYLWSSKVHRYYSTTTPPRRSRVPGEVSLNTKTADYSKVPPPARLERVTATQLASCLEFPKNVSMLMRDFIQDCLYNPHYGYFSKQALIFSSEQPINFNCLRNSRQLDDQILKVYGDYSLPVGVKGPGRQVWHTPTELFKPWYGQAIAQCILSEYMLKSYPYDDLVIYEVGAGNGTLANDVLEYIRDEYPPDVYERVRYNIIEISPQLARLQADRLECHTGVRVYNQSVFEWSERDASSCFVIALEVVDNFPHDEIRYSMESREPLQGVVTIDENGEFAQRYEPVTDSLIASYLRLRADLGRESPVMPPSSSFLRRLRASIPFAPNLSKPEFVPTRLLQLLTILRDKFPRHRLLLSDFSELPDTLPGYNSPVVQTRIGEHMVPCQTLLVKPGYFDIFFPTHFKMLRDMYEHIMAKPFVDTSCGPRASPLLTSSSRVDLGAHFFFSHDRRPPGDSLTSTSGLPIGGRKSSVFTHREFMETYATLSGTRLRNGENPLLDYYQNVKFLF